MVIDDIPSPNFGPRREGAEPRLIVLHYTAMAPLEAALERLCAPEHAVSAHFLVAADGRVIRLVEEAARAWHAGAGAWGGCADVNSHSIGIELDNTGTAPFAEPQMRSLEALLDAVMGRWRIGPEGVLAHSDIAPARKSDPGPRFDWRRLALGGRAVWPVPGDAMPATMAHFMADAERFGYRGAPDQVLRAFRLRFRPWALGAALESADMAGIAALARAHPCLDPGAADA